MIICDPFHIFKCQIYQDHKYEAVFHSEQLKRGMFNFPFFPFPKSFTNFPKEVKICLIPLKFIMFHIICLGEGQLYLRSVHFSSTRSISPL